MKIKKVHPWEVTPQEAIAIQKRLREKIQLKRRIDKLEKVAAVDVAYQKNIAIAGVISFSYPELVVREKTLALSSVRFPYIPGLLTFREGPPVIKALGKLEEKPDLLLFDGQGIAHPRRMGIATHLGIYLDIPSLGCAKSKLTGEHSLLKDNKGAHQPLYDGKQIVGFAVRTKEKTRPIFVSPGNWIDLETALKVVLNLHRGYRIPEPLRLVHIFVNKNKGGHDIAESLNVKI